eukprot:PhM_4_TR17826/c0_g1_i1/m.105594
MLSSHRLSRTLGVPSIRSKQIETRAPSSSPTRPVTSRRASCRQKLEDAQRVDVLNGETYGRVQLVTLELRARRRLLDQHLRLRQSWPRPPPTPTSSTTGNASPQQRKRLSLLPPKAMRTPSANSKMGIQVLERELREQLLRQESTDWLKLTLVRTARRKSLPGGPVVRRDTTPVFAPDVKSSAVCMNTMIKLANIQPTDVVYDVGCGDGELLSIIGKRWPEVRGVGIEIRRNKVKEALLRVSELVPRISIVEGDALDIAYGEATVILMYLVPKALAAVGRRILADCKPGTKVISQLFPVPGFDQFSITPDESVGRARGMWCYQLPQRPVEDVPTPLAVRPGI